MDHAPEPGTFGAAGPDHDATTEHSAAGDYLALTESHDGDAGQNLGVAHNGGQDTATDYAQMAGYVAPPDDHQPPPVPDYVLTGSGPETDGGASHSGLPAGHEDAAAAAPPPVIDMPTETDHGVHGH